MTLDQLKTLIASGEFHHATYRNHGSIWEGLYVYKKYDGLRGFDVAGAFGKADPNLDAAYEIVRASGVSFGSYGGG